MPGPGWAYNPGTKRFHRNGRMVGNDTIVRWAYAYADAACDVVTALGSQVATGGLRVENWHALMRQAVKNQYVNQYMLGRGGIGQMTQRDWGIVGRQLRDQYHYLDRFAAEIATGELSEAQINARARMYINAAHEAYERAKCEAYGMPPLPAYPADGQTQCLSNCRCEWVVDELRIMGVLIGWDAMWKLNPAEHCPDCLANAALWDPLLVPANMTATEARAWRDVEVARMHDAHGLKMSEADDLDLGRPGSGHWAHLGRRGEIGGSKPRESGMSVKSGETWLERYKAKTGRAHPHEQAMKRDRADALRREGKPTTGAEVAKRLATYAERYSGDLRRADKAVVDLASEREGILREMDAVTARLQARGVDLLGRNTDPEFAALYERYVRQCDVIERAQMHRESVREAYARAVRNLLRVDKSEQVSLELAYVEGAPDDLPLPPDALSAMRFLRGLVSSQMAPDSSLVRMFPVFDARSGYSAEDDVIIYDVLSGPRAMVHEMGHWFEQHCRQARERLFAFYEDRTRNEPPISLNDLLGTTEFHASEATRVDKFLHPYMGKEYVRNGVRVATEILSMGLEALSRDPLGLAIGDPEYFAVIFDVIRGIE